MKIKSLIASALLAGVCVPAVHAALPDSVYMFSYARADGSGLRLAWSADSCNWNDINDAEVFLSSDFGPWGGKEFSKRMYSPKLTQSAYDGLWHCTWFVSPSDSTVAHTQSDDLLLWSPQTYHASAAEMPANFTPTPKPVNAAVFKIGNSIQKGYVQKVPYQLIVRLNRYADHRRYRKGLNAETMAQDSYKYASLKPFKAGLKVFPDSAKGISDKLIGIFFEDINYGADGGLYAELVQNRDFEYNQADRKNWTHSYAWSVSDGSDGVLEIDTVMPLHANNRHYAVLRGNAVKNNGYDGIPVKKGAKYRFSLYGRAPEGNVQLEVSLVGGNGLVVASEKIKVSSKNWKKVTATLMPSADADSAELFITPAAGRTLHVDMVSLFPQATFKGRENGLRADLAEILAGLKPKFVRFPGGCVAHGNGVDNIYDWKGSIGELYERKPLSNLWGYHQTRGLGYHEYFLFCEDLGAEPLPVLAAGVPCQNSSVPSAHSHNLVTTNGQQCGVPMEQMPQYIQDVLDLIEYANGDAKTSRWGRVRAKAGHPEPFNMKYIGIGNEDLISPVFVERFTMICNAVSEKYPDIKIVGTSGPFYEGSDYTYGWQLADSMHIPLVDEHYYVAPGWMVNNQDFYDNYDRDKPHVYLGEYAAHLPGRQSNVETALTEALYLLSVERNADVVEMTSYAPLLAKEGHTQWRPDLIYFNNTKVKPTVDYYVQKLFGNNSGEVYIASKLSAGNLPATAMKRQGASVVFNKETDTYIVKIANLLPVATSLALDLGNIPVNLSEAEVTVLSGNPSDTGVSPQTKVVSIADGNIELLPYSFTVIRLKKLY